MNANIYEYGTDPKTGLKRRLIRDSALVQEEMDTNPKPKAVVFLRLQTYVENEGEVVGQGTGDLKTHLDALKENNIKLYVSGMSAKARGYDESLLDGFNAKFAMPDKLLEL